MNAAVLALLLWPGVGTAEPLQTPGQHAAAGLAAAKQFAGYGNLCDLEARIRNVNVPRGRSAERPRQRGERSERRHRPLPPTQIFDNLYAFGTSSVLAWLYGTSEGYILIDGLNNDDEAERFIIGGMAALGLDPGAIKYVLVTHAHGDHYGGADYVASKLNVEIMMSAPDWELAARIGDHPRFGPPPKSGLTVSDGQVVRFGRSELTVHLTPGHTPGTVSPIFEVRDGDVPHMAMLWGGTGFNFGPVVQTFLTYANSARKMRSLARGADVDVFLSGHPNRSGTFELVEALAARQPGGPHPFVKGDAGYALFTVFEQCALAQAARFLTLQK